jgi:hypothetical protein
MNLRKIAILVGGAALTLSLIGAGVGASFTGTVTANQQVNVGRMSVAVVTGANATLQPDGSILCNVVNVTTPDGTGSLCTFTISSNGSIPATHWSVSQIETGLSAAQITPDVNGDVKFGTTFGAFRSAAATVVASGSLPATLDPAATWGQDTGGVISLDNSDFGTSFWITYTVTVTP